jgi:hypothetical protein
MARLARRVRRMKRGRVLRSGRIVGVAAILALLGADAASAAQIVGHETMMVETRGSLAGARLNLPLFGRDTARLGLAVAPMQRWREGGSVAMGRGLELGLTRRGKLEFAAGGRTLRLDERRRTESRPWAGWRSALAPRLPSAPRPSSSR